ncbi:unnamed protein product [Lampetra planeri]
MTYQASQPTASIQGATNNAERPTEQMQFQMRDEDDNHDVHHHHHDEHRHHHDEHRHHHDDDVHHHDDIHHHEDEVHNDDDHDDDDVHHHEDEIHNDDDHDDDVHHHEDEIHHDDDHDDDVHHHDEVHNDDDIHHHEDEIHNDDDHDDDVHHHEEVHHDDDHDDDVHHHEDEVHHDDDVHHHEDDDDVHHAPNTREAIIRLFGCTSSSTSTTTSADAIAHFNILAHNYPKEVLATVWETLEIHQDWNGTLHTLAEAQLWRAMLHPCPSHIAPADTATTGGSGTILPVFEATCRALYREWPDKLTPFVRLAHLQRASITTGGAPGCSATDAPLYKRATSVLPRAEEAIGAARAHVDLLLSSWRPRAVLRALQLLLRLREAETAVTEATVRSKGNPLLRREAFRLLLAEVGRTRLLDSQLRRVFELCPSRVSAEEALLEIVRGAAEAGDAAHAKPFLFDAPSLTLGMLKPLLVRLLSDDVDDENDEKTEDDDDGGGDGGGGDDASFDEGK